MTTKIYIVYGESGDYSDREKWLVKAFKTIKQAEEFIKDVETEANNILWDLKNKKIKRSDVIVNKYDSNFRIYGDHITYDYEELEIE
jgi:hypothetical protein